MNAKETDRLKKLVALFDSPNGGERDNAIAAATALLRRHGKSMVDLPAILGHGGHGSVDKGGIDGGDFYGAWQAASDASGKRQAAEEEARKTRSGRNADGTYVFYNMNNPQDAAAYEEKRREQHEADLRKEAPERAAVIERYGSEEAAIAPCEREKMLRAAVLKWSKSCTKPHQRWTKSIDGHSDAYDILHGEKPSKRVKDAISEAYPLPETIEGAIAEEAYWSRRGRELKLVLKPQYGDDDGLDLPARIRQDILDDMIEAGIPARNVREILLRIQARGRHMASGKPEDCWMSERLQNAVIADLKALCAASETVVSHDEFRAARQNREKPPVRQKERHVNPAQRDFEF